MKLNDLLKDIEIIEIKGNTENIEISDIQYNSKNITPNSIFVAIKGHQVDGHKYINNAIENGAKVCVVEEFTEDLIPQIKVKDTRATLADLSNLFFDNPSKKLNVVGITATNGKTTTSFMVDSIFRHYGLKTGLVGTVEVKYGDVSIPSLLTTPESRDLQEHTKNMVEYGVTDLIMEVSSHAQEMHRIKNMDYDIVSFNNLSRDHIDQHGSFENYAEIKSGLIKKAKEDAYVILNYDYVFIKNLKDQTKGKVLSYSIESKDCDFGIENLDLSTGYAKFDFLINKDIEELGLNKQSVNFELGIAGYSGVMNAVVAIIISLVRKIPIEDIKDALKKFKGVERRFQVIYEDEFMIVDDHYANSKNIAVTMETISKMDFNNFHILYAIRGNRGPNLNRESAEETVKWLNILGINKIYSTSSVEAVTWKDEVFEEEKQAFEKVMNNNNIEIIHFDRLDESIFNILKVLKNNDLLLLAGCQGMDSGGRIILEKITEKMEPDKKNEILKVLEGRAF